MTLTDLVSTVSAMTRDEAIQRLRKLAEPPVDPEVAHAEAEKILLDVIGDDEVRDAFDAVEKWYA